MRSNEIRTPFGVRFPVTSLTGGRRAKSMRVYHRLLSRHAFGVKKRPNSAAPASAERLQQFVSRTAAAFRRNPIDDFIRIHDVAGFAVDTIRCVNLQTQSAI